MTNAAASRISSDLDQMYTLAVQAYNASQNGLSNTAGLTLNLKKIAAFAVKFGEDFAFEAIPFAELILNGTTWGASSPDPIGDAVLAGASTGAVIGAYSGFGNIAVSAAQN